MRVLFVVKEKESGISPFIQSQAESLRREGVEVVFFTIEGKGITSYFTSAMKLHLFLKKNSFDIIHAHYGLSGWTAFLSFSHLPIVVSLMGSDILGEYQGERSISVKSRFVRFSTFLLQYFVTAIISKSNNIHNRLSRKSISTIIPNGIDFQKVNYTGKNCREDLGLKLNMKYVLFLGNPKDKWKNFSLAKKAVDLIDREDVELIAPFPVPHEIVVKYLNATTVFLHTSFMEGSSNVIKEAMACNCPIVSTEVGDAKWIIGETEGCFLTDFSIKKTANKIELALRFADKHRRTKGRERIQYLGLDTVSVAKKIMGVYTNSISKL